MWGTVWDIIRWILGFGAFLVFLLVFDWVSGVWRDSHTATLERRRLRAKKVRERVRRQES